MAFRTLAPLRRRLFVAPLFLLVCAFLLLLDARSAYAQDIWHVDDSINDGLVSLWRFDDLTAVPTIYDLVGGSHGTAITATVAITSNRPALNYLSAGVLDLRGTLDYVQLPNDPALNTSDEFTLAAWVYRRNAAGNQTIFDAGTGTNDWVFYINPANQLGFGPQGMANTLTVATIPLEQWTHVAVAVSSGSDNVNLYINGVSAGPINLGTVSPPTGIKQIGATSTQITVPFPFLLQSGYFEGFIDEMHFYDRPLSAGEVGLLASGSLCVTDGEGWSTAFRFLECTDAASTSGDEIWIGAGRYLPAAARQLSFFLEHNVAIYGGFLGLSPGGGETALGQRSAFDPAAPLTVITGDLLGNDLPLGATPDPFANHTENVRVLMRGSEFEHHKLDGLELRGGFANAAFAIGSNGAALNEDGVALEMKNMVFRQNYALGYGGAISSTTAISATNLTFVGNIAGFGGGGLSTTEDLFLASSTFLSNTVGSQGGALQASENTHLYDVHFQSNRAAGVISEGGAVALIASDPFSATIRNSSFLGNSSRLSGAVVAFGANVEPRSGTILIENSLFSNNNAFVNGGLTDSLDADDIRIFYMDASLLHNTFFGPSGAGPSIVTILSSGEMLYNIFNSQQVALRAGENSSIAEDYNLFVDNSFSQSNNGVVNSGGNSLNGDPHFADADAGNFHITFASNARDAAATSNTPIDFEGDTRPRGDGSDIGYDESPFARPIANAGGPHALNEGASLPLDGSASSDTDNLITQWSWDCTNDGTFDQVSGSATGNSCAYADNGLFTLRLRTEDATGLADLYTTTVTVNNVAPSVTSATAQTATTGQSKAFSLGSFTDPGADAPWQVRVNWGDGSADSIFNATTPGALAPQNHTYTSAATRTVTVTVTDKDGGSQSKTFQVTVTAGGGNGSPTPETPTPEATPVVFLPAIQGK